MEQLLHLSSKVANVPSYGIKASSRCGHLGFDRRLTVGSPSSHKHNFLFKLSTLLMMFILSAGNVWAADVKDELTSSDFAATGTTYTNFSGVSKSSGAVYAGSSAKDNSGNIQLKSKNSNTGIVSTTSGGTVKSVKITVGSGSNTVDVYGSNTAYTDATDLYGNNAGTKIGSVTSTGTVNFTGNYAYVGIRSNSGAIYLSSVEITWTVAEQHCSNTITISKSTPTNGSFSLNLFLPHFIPQKPDLFFSLFQYVNVRFCYIFKCSADSTISYSRSTSQMATHCCFVSNAFSAATSSNRSVVNDSFSN